MPTIKSKAAMSADATTLAQTFECVQYQNSVYIPADYETGDWKVTPDNKRKIWRRIDQNLLYEISQQQFDMLFATDADRAIFENVLWQSSQKLPTAVDTIFIKTADGLKELRGNGQLHPPSGKFTPNFIGVELNTNTLEVAEVRTQIVEWLGSEEEATALLRHLATALAPHWSAVKYVLLLGDGRNGKSLLMKMMEQLFGETNVSNVSRQAVADGSPVVVEVNGKLLNIIFDGAAKYLDDSGNEKSLIAGEKIPIRMLYKSTSTSVQTNALFIEGLNREPKSRDKSSALQQRLVRFWFKNTYEDDLEFWDHMTSEKMLGALLFLLIQNYVRKEEKSVMLAPTVATKQLQIEHMTDNSKAMQFVAYHVNRGTHEDLLDMELEELAEMFNRWLITTGETRIWSQVDVRNAFKPVIEMERKSKRTNGRVGKVVYVKAFKKETLEMINDLLEEESDALVGD